MVFIWYEILLRKNWLIYSKCVTSINKQRVYPCWLNRMILNIVSCRRRNSWLPISFRWVFSSILTAALSSRREPSSPKISQRVVLKYMISLPVKMRRPSGMLFSDSSSFIYRKCFARAFPLFSLCGALQNTPRLSCISLWVQKALRCKRIITAPDPNCNVEYKFAPLGMA